MIIRNTTLAMMLLAATGALAQGGQPGTTAAEPIPNRQAVLGRRGPVANRPVDPQGVAAIRERVTEMEKTLSDMRLVLKKMRANADKSKTTDSLTKTNLELWELMVGHLDKELEQLRTTLATREDLESRRAALYKQADAKAAAEAQAFRAAQAARFAQAGQNGSGTPPPAGQSAEQSQSPQSAPVQPSAAPATNPGSPK